MGNLSNLTLYTSPLLYRVSIYTLPRIAGIQGDVTQLTGKEASTYTYESYLPPQYNFSKAQIAKPRMETLLLGIPPTLGKIVYQSILSLYGKKEVNLQAHLDEDGKGRWNLSLIRKEHEGRKVTLSLVAIRPTDPLQSGMASFKVESQVIGSWELAGQSKVGISHLISANRFALKEKVISLSLS
ncbi:hypothetical protein SDJN03_15769, partial [Cucurbita argyrosperma subsp. sororia]